MNSVYMSSSHVILKVSIFCNELNLTENHPDIEDMSHFTNLLLIANIRIPFFNCLYFFSPSSYRFYNEPVVFTVDIM